MLVAVSMSVLGGAGLLAAQDEDGGEATEGTAGEAAPILVAEVDSIIQPVVAGHLEEVLVRAAERDAAALVIQLNTPGGLLDSTRDIFEAMLASPVPVVVYVAPPGAQAASAGFFLLMAADVAAMAPGTNTGAAHPVQGTGQEVEGVMAEKVEQDAASTIRSLAGRHGRNIELAEAAVVKSRSFTAEEALEGELIDFIAEDLDELVAQLEGFQPRGERIGPLTVADARVEHLEMPTWRKALSVLAHPTIAYLLISLGGLGLYFELANPGSVFPGVIGALFLILGFFALSVLPVNYAGVALIALALLLFLLEIKVMSYGLLTLAGASSLIIGSLMLFRSPDPAMRVSLGAIVGVALLAVLVVWAVTFIILRDRRRQVRTGVEGMLGERGVVRAAINPRGKVFLHGEYWNAVADSPVAVGEEIEVVGVDGMTLRVQTTRDKES